MVQIRFSKTPSDLCFENRLNIKVASLKKSFLITLVWNFFFFFYSISLLSWWYVISNICIYLITGSVSLPPWNTSSIGAEIVSHLA